MGGSMSEPTGAVTEPRPESVNIRAGDAEAADGAIPNLIASLVETETWRNAATVALGLLLIGLGYWTYTGVRTALAETRAASLEALLGTVVRGLDVWAYEHMADAQRAARNATVVAQASAFIRNGRSTPAEPGRCTQEAERLSEEVQSRLSTSGVVAFRILDRDGRVLSSKDPLRCGQRIRSGVFRDRLDLVFEGKPQFVRPFPDVEELSVRDAGGMPRPVAWFMAPIRTGSGPPEAALAMGVATDRELETIFMAARPGATGEAYAFGDTGLMLSSPRWHGLPAGGADMPRSAVSPTERTYVRDPGGSLGDGHVPTLEVAARPLTRAAAQAITARGKAAEIDRHGVITTPYRNYRGTEVIGAWQWLPDYDFGVVAEIAADEAFSTLRYVTISLSVIGGVLALTLFAAFLSAYLLSRLSRQFGRVQRLGAYTLERQLSEGGMATIYLARHALLKRPTAIKILKKHVATDEFIHRFEREVQLASQLLHPNTVEIYDFGRTREGQPYYVMEYLDGVTLAELVAHSGRVPPGRVIHILRQVAAALREAHAKGMVHRDVKPENVMLCRRGEDDVVKLLDFGLVKNLERAETRDITKQLKIVGTPRYMAPERLLNPSDVDARSDLYALGAVAYYLLTGRPIFEGDDSLAISNQVLHRPAPSVRDAGVEIPEPFELLIASCLEKDRNRRPPSAEAFIEALDRVASRLAWTQVDAARWWAEYRKSRGSGPAAARSEPPAEAVSAPAGTAGPARS
jgi:serine/threonine-protein kinase